MVDQSRYPQVSVPSVIPLPTPPRKVEEMLPWMHRLHNVLAQNQARLSETIRLTNYHRVTISDDGDVGSGGAATGGTDNMPPASGSNNVHIDVDETTGLNKAFVDILDAGGSPAWFEINSLKELYVTDSMWDDLRISATATKEGSSQPGFASFMDNGAGSTGVFAYAFDSAVEEQLFFTVQLPHTWEEGTAIEAHVQWCPSQSTVIDAGVAWGLEYTWQNINAVFGNTSFLGGSTVKTFAADEHLLTELGAINATGKTMSSVLVCRVFRDVGDADDDYPQDAFLLGINFHYKVNSLGSSEKYVKGP